MVSVATRILLGRVVTRVRGEGLNVCDQGMSFHIDWKKLSRERTEVDASLLNGVDCLMLFPTAVARPERRTEADMIEYTGKRQ